MARIDLRSEIEHYLGYPYAKNEWKNNILVNEAVLGGKGDWRQLDEATRCAAQKEGLDIALLTKEDLYKLRKRNKIGIDCSGLVYNLLDYIDREIGGAGILYKVTGSNKLAGKLGVRKVSADDMCKPHNSKKICLSEIKNGDVIRMDSGKHIILVVEVGPQEITYIHSSDRTKQRGVHYGKILIDEKSLDLNDGIWNEETLDNRNYRDLYRINDGDGIYRLLFLEKFLAS